MSSTQRTLTAGSKDTLDLGTQKGGINQFMAVSTGIGGSGGGGGEFGPASLA
jgi:hypothetical protein